MSSSIGASSHSVKHSFFDYLSEAGKISSGPYLTKIQIKLVSNCLDCNIAKSIAVIGEIRIRGIGSLFQALVFLDGSKTIKGAIQLGAGIGGLIVLPFNILGSSLYILIIPIFTAIYPNETSTVLKEVLNKEL